MLKPKLRRFKLYRTLDESGVSGIGTIAEGVKFTNGYCSLSWLTEKTSWGMYRSVAEMMSIHGHDGNTELQWIDTDE